MVWLLGFGFISKCYDCMHQLPCVTHRNEAWVRELEYYNTYPDDFKYNRFMELQ